MAEVPRAWMWAEACAMMEQAERLRREFFRPDLTALQIANWEPPVDIFETDHQVVVWVALPGVDPKELQVVIDGDVIAIKGVRHLPESARDGTIHRLECPYGRFERRLRLPSTRLQLDHSELQAGCLTVSLNKVP